MKKRFRCSLKLPIFCIFVLVATSEWLEYLTTPIFVWPKLFHDYSSSSVVKILVVADPQLLGFQYTIGGVLGYIVRWDADRYVRKTFKSAYNFLSPDLVIFLGDIFDESEVATDHEFNSYLKRFLQVFQEVNFNKAIIIPGDNDIGGENGPPLPDKVQRFNKYFKNDVYIEYKFVELVKVNYITHSNDYQEAPSDPNSSVRIVLSHIPLTPYYGSFVNKVIPYLHPHIILSAHDHKSQYIVADRKTGSIFKKPSLAPFNSAIFNVSDLVLHEILVPTCSYRMGTSKMGYGALQIDSDGKVTYSVLWLPQRFRQLVGHLIALILLLGFVLLYIVKKYFKRNKTNNYVQL